MKFEVEVQVEIYSMYDVKVRSSNSKLKFEGGSSIIEDSFKVDERSSSSDIAIATAPAFVCVCNATLVFQ